MKSLELTRALLHFQIWLTTSHIIPSQRIHATCSAHPASKPSQIVSVTAIHDAWLAPISLSVTFASHHNFFTYTISVFPISVSSKHCLPSGKHTPDINSKTKSQVAQNCECKIENLCMETSIHTSYDLNMHFSVDSEQNP